MKTGNDVFQKSSQATPCSCLNEGKNTYYRTTAKHPVQWYLAFSVEQQSPLSSFMHSIT